VSRLLSNTIACFVQFEKYLRSKHWNEVIKWLAQAPALDYNKTMIYIIVGILGFAAALAFDWASLKRIPVIKQLVGLLAIFLLVYASVMVCHSPAKLELPIPARIIGGCLLPVFLCLLVYSLFIELPFRSTYAEQGVGNKLIGTGTYALVRHPGVIWLAIVYLSLALLFPSTTLFFAIIIWLVMDIIYVILQEKLFFLKMFPNYRDYQRQTPFLIPTRQSISACLKSIDRRTKARS
jgi:protein-S-isoprenylcysteine O-methyltransferase Ste14